jgi:hypothetical protein
MQMNNTIPKHASLAICISSGKIDRCKSCSELENAIHLPTYTPKALHYPSLHRIFNES